MKHHILKLASLFLILVIAGAGLYVWYRPLRATVSVWVKAAQDIVHNKESLVTDMSSEFFTNPLRAGDDKNHDPLTGAKIIELTNIERAELGLPALTENEELNNAAKAKFQDMFIHQYFEHVSPTGKGPGWVASQAGYSYIVVGENLAMGNFKDNAALVAAWMASEGHKANILNDRFKEIGVAVGEGTYQGKKVWMAVQEFGLPATECPRIDGGLRSRIDLEKHHIATLEENLEVMREEINSMPRNTQEEQAAYQQKAENYNTQVTTYNNAIIQLKKDTEIYNSQVRDFNACIKG